MLIIAPTHYKISYQQMLYWCSRESARLSSRSCTTEFLCSLTQFCSSRTSRLSIFSRSRLTTSHSPGLSFLDCLTISQMRLRWNYQSCLISCTSSRFSLMVIEPSCFRDTQTGFCLTGLQLVSQLAFLSRFARSLWNSETWLVFQPQPFAELLYYFFLSFSRGSFLPFYSPQVRMLWQNCSSFMVASKYSPFLELNLQLLRNIWFMSLSIQPGCSYLQFLRFYQMVCRSMGTRTIQLQLGIDRALGSTAVRKGQDASCFLSFLIMLALLLISSRLLGTSLLSGAQVSSASLFFFLLVQGGYFSAGGSSLEQLLMALLPGGALMTLLGAAMAGCREQQRGRMDPMQAFCSGVSLRVSSGDYSQEEAMIQGQ